MTSKSENNESECKYDLIYNIILIIHILFWLFLLIAFLFPKLALFNILFLLPIVYLIHIFPQHPLNSAEQMLCPDRYKKDRHFNETEAFKKYQNQAEKFCTFSPISYQGMMIFSYITCVISLYCRGYVKLNI